MRAAIPSDLLLRLMSATPEQYAAVERILGVTTETLKSEMLKGEMEPEVCPTVSEDVARSAFALLQKLELDAPLKAPSVLTVFRLYCVDGYSAEQVARKCRCGKATVIRRLQFIEARTGVKAEQFRAMSGHLQQIDDDLNASGAREIYRRGLSGNVTSNWNEED
ncbi:MAG TPA: hypothetical protein VK327_08140 [Candidatus Paceibacterota bacterium]|nr:hypothetical protein [Candidatus Paceibacterota bacterium]